MQLTAPDTLTKAVPLELALILSSTPRYLRADVYCWTLMLYCAGFLVQRSSRVSHEDV